MRARGSARLDVERVFLRHAHRQPSSRLCAPSCVCRVCERWRRRNRRSGVGKTPSARQRARPDAARDAEQRERPGEGTGQCASSKVHRPRGTRSVTVRVISFICLPHRARGTALRQQTFGPWCPREYQDAAHARYTLRTAAHGPRDPAMDTPPRRQTHPTYTQTRGVCKSTVTPHLSPALWSSSHPWLLGRKRLPPPCRWSRRRCCRAMQRCLPRTHPQPGWRPAGSSSR